MKLRFLVANIAAALVTTPPPHSAAALQAGRGSNPSESRIPVGITSLYARAIGQGPPVIVLHGGPDFDHGYLLPDLDRLKDSFRLIYYDQRGRGRSAERVRPEDVTLVSDVEDIDRVSQHFGLDAPALLGHSWGAVLALEYALRHPTRVSRLILMNPAPASASDVAVVRKAYLERLGREMDRQRSIVESSAYQEGDPESVAARYRIHFKPALDSLRVPTLVIAGDHDFMVGAAERIARAIPNAQLVTIKDCGHFAFLECPDEVRRAVNALFRRP